LIRQIKAREDKLLHDRTALSNKKRKTTIFIIVLGTGVSIMAVLIGLYFTRKSKLELDIVNQLLQQHNNQLLNFSHITTHNLRSPVNNLNSLLSFYKESKDEEDRRVLLQKFETVIQHLTTSLNELMETLRIQEDTEKTRELIMFEDIFIKIKETLAGSILETGSRVTADFSKAKKIEYPRSYLESIMLNLLSNAIKYRSPERIPEIHFQTKYHNGQAILTVSDNGLGIDLQIYGDQLFNLNKTFHEHPEARCVGLFITRTQVEAMGGSISAESKVDEGTTFIVVL
jgi:signal transduction histidine kinase